MRAPKKSCNVLEIVEKIDHCSSFFYNNLFYFILLFIFYLFINFFPKVFKRIARKNLVSGHLKNTSSLSLETENGNIENVF